MTITAYLAGPDVFLPDAVEHAARKSRDLPRVMVFAACRR